MATFLTTSKMSPALAARVESSVRGRRVRPGESVLGPRLKSLLRPGLVVLALFGLYSFVQARRMDAKKLENDRAALLDTLRVQSESLTDGDKSALERDEVFLQRFAGAYEGDFVEPSLRAPGALGGVLSRPSVYVRGPIDVFRTQKAIAAAAAASGKDAFLLCLLDPPSPRTEKALLGRVRVAYAGGAALETQMAHVRRLDDAEAGLPFLLPAFADRVRASSSDGELAVYRREVDAVTLDHAKEALKAEVLIAVMDEPARAGGVTEIDGERPHDVRIAVVERASAKLLVRLQKHVDPSGWSPPNRSQYASGLDGCALALDVQAHVTQ